MTSYSYDNASQLTGLTYANGATALGNLAYGYDLVVRRMSENGGFARDGFAECIEPDDLQCEQSTDDLGHSEPFLRCEREYDQRRSRGLSVTSMCSPLAFEAGIDPSEQFAKGNSEA